MKRRCGSCTLCCTTLAVPSLDKPAGVPCIHLTPNGCGRYDTRPQECRDFECAWLLGRPGLTDPGARPDHVHAVVGGDATRWGWTMYVDPADPDRWQRYKTLRRFVSRAVRGGRSVFVVAGDRRRVYTNDEEVLAMLRSHDWDPHPDGSMGVSGVRGTGGDPADYPGGAT